MGIILPSCRQLRGASRVVSSLSEQEKAIYEWQMWVPGFGESGQAKLKDASVLISRCGGLGGVVAYELAAAGIGRLIIAHGGNVKPSDLNRQLLMTHDWIGKPRIESIGKRLRELRPDIKLELIPENINEKNAHPLVSQADVVVDCAPLFEERFLLNQAAVHYKKPMIECAMYELEAQITTIVPGETPCLSCLFPEKPPQWRREFPVFGAVSGTVGCLAAMEAIKWISGLGEPLTSQLLMCDLSDMSLFKSHIKRNPSCKVCGHHYDNAGS